MDVLKLLRRPSAFLPIMMSLLALGLVIAQISLYGIAPEHDEGAAAHVFQLSIAAQLPIILFFAVRFIPKSPRTQSRSLDFRCLRCSWR